MNVDSDAIRAALTVLPRGKIEAFEVFAEIDSTNTYLLGKAAPATGSVCIAIADQQTAGRGTRGRHWYSPSGSGLCLSMSWTFQNSAQVPPCLTLAIGIGIARALEQLGVRGIRLKWPNDLVVDDGKLGGILTEVHTISPDALTIVAGVGINFDLRGLDESLDIAPQIGRVSDLVSCMNELPAREVVLAALIDSMFDALCRFTVDREDSVVAAWRKYDWLQGKTITVEVANRKTVGRYVGVDATGALLLDTDAGVQRFLSGTVSPDDGACAQSDRQTGGVR